MPALPLRCMPCQHGLCAACHASTHVKHAGEAASAPPEALGGGAARARGAGLRPQDHGCGCRAAPRETLARTAWENGELAKMRLISPPSTAFHRLPPPLTASHARGVHGRVHCCRTSTAGCLSPPFTAFHRLSPPFTAFHRGMAVHTAAGRLGQPDRAEFGAHKEGWCCLYSCSHS